MLSGTPPLDGAAVAEGALVVVLGVVVVGDDKCVPRPRAAVGAVAGVVVAVGWTVLFVGCGVAAGATKDIGRKVDEAKRRAASVTPLLPPTAADE